MSRATTDPWKLLVRARIVERDRERRAARRQLVNRVGAGLATPSELAQVIGFPQYPQR